MDFMIKNMNGVLVGKQVFMADMLVRPAKLGIIFEEKLIIIL
jgi:hypothetical protein